MAEQAIGIDLGTTYSCVAVYRKGLAEVISNLSGSRTTPSSVAFHGNDYLIGEAAVNQSTMNPANTVFGIKRLIGRRWRDPAVQEDINLWPFRVVRSYSGRPLIAVLFRETEKEFSPEEISSMILAYMRKIAEVFLDRPVTKAVVTVPAYFNDSQRRATMDACAIAGLEVLRVVNEPTAAAFAYGLLEMAELRGQSKYILVFDLGGGTLDVTVLLMRDNQLEVKANAGDAHLGGEDFSNRIVKYMAAEFRKKTKLDITGNARALHRLRMACEKAKRDLSFNHEVFVNIDCITNGQDLYMRLTRARFEDINMDLFENSMKVLQQCMENLNGIGKESISEVILVGGSSRIPKIVEMVKEFFGGKELNKTINPDESIAQGAAMLATKIIGRDDSLRNLRLFDVTPLSLGVETKGGKMTKLIERGTRIPARNELVFSTAVAGQTAVQVKVFQGESLLTMENHFLGVFRLEGIRRESVTVPKIRICFDVDTNGILTVTAEDTASGLKEEMVVSYEDGRLSAAEINAMVVEAEKYRRDDEERRRKIHARNDMESYMNEVRRKMQTLSLSRDDMGKVDSALKRASDWFDSNGQSAGAGEIDGVRRELEIVWSDVNERLRYV